MTCLKPEGREPGAGGAGGIDFNDFAGMQPRRPGTTPKARRNGAPVKAHQVAPRGVYIPNYNILTTS